MSMDSPLYRPIISDIVFQDLESDILNKLTIKLSFYIHYVDDIVLAIDKTHIDDLYNMFNNYHSKLSHSFTLEEKGWLYIYEGCLINTHVREENT